MTPPAPKPVRVLIVDDHHVVRLGLRAALEESRELTVIGDAPSGEEALKFCEQNVPEVVLLDVRLPGMSGFEACRALKQRWPAIKVLFLTSYGDDSSVLKAAEAGADGYLLKAVAGQDITSAILKSAAGGVVLDPAIARQVLNRAANPAQSQPTPLQSLSAHEHRVLELLTEGQTNKEIANALGIAEKTVRNQLTSIFQKLGVTSRTQAAAVVFEQRTRSAA
jgi:two-component system response regulator DevR